MPQPKNTPALTLASAYAFSSQNPKRAGQALSRSRRRYEQAAQMSKGGASAGAKSTKKSSTKSSAAKPKKKTGKLTKQGGFAVIDGPASKPKYHKKPSY